MPIPSEYVSRGVRIQSDEGVFHFHRRRDGHGDGCVVRTWKIEGKSEKDVITRDCMGLDDAFAVVCDHLEEMAYLLSEARAEFGY